MSALSDSFQSVHRSFGLDIHPLAVLVRRAREGESRMGKDVANVHQLTDSVFAAIGVDGATNFGIIKGNDDSAVLIDADIRRMDEIDDALRRTGCTKVRYLVNTHENFDHSSANDYFEKSGAVVIGTEGCWRALQEDGESKFAEMAGRSPELWTKFPGLKMGNLQIAFPQEVTLRLPGVAVRILYAAHNGKSHSRGDAIAILEKDRILFAGDLLYTDYHPVTVYGDIRNWVQSINHLMDNNFVSVVPGHGPVSSGGNDVYKHTLVKFRSYLEDFDNRLKEIKSGKKSPGEVESYMQSGEYAAMGKTWMVKRNIECFLKDAN
jgi:cyclase